LMIDTFKIMTYNMSCCTFALPEITVSSIDWLSIFILMRHIHFRKNSQGPFLRNENWDLTDPIVLVALAFELGG